MLLFVLSKLDQIWMLNRWIMIRFHLKIEFSKHEFTNVQIDAHTEVATHSCFNNIKQKKMLTHDV